MAHLSSYDIKFNELYVEPSYICNARCKHCYVSSNPATDPTVLNIDIILSTIDQLVDIDEIAPRVAIAGGEPTLYWNNLLRIIQHAANYGFTVILISNGWWGKTKDMCIRKLGELATHGLTKLEISTSIFHREFVDVSAINNIVNYCNKYNIDCALHIRTNQSSQHKDNINLLKNIENIEVISIPIAPIGRAEEEINKREFFYTHGFPKGNCRKEFSFLITPRGDCFPCCGGTELTDYLKLGNIITEPLLEIVKRSKRRKLIYYLLNNGPSKIAEAISIDGFKGILSNNSYVSSCDLCFNLFKSPVMALAAERWVNCPHSTIEQLNICESITNNVYSYEPRVSMIQYQPDIDKIKLPHRVLNKIFSILNDSFDSIKRYGELQPSGALLFVVDNYYIKLAELPYSKRLEAQFHLLKKIWNQGIHCVPEVYFKFSNKNGFVGYVMKKYSINIYNIEMDIYKMINQVVDCLKKIWQIPQAVVQPIDWNGYINKVKKILLTYDLEYAQRIEYIGNHIKRVNHSKTSCMIHGDPTFENIVFDEERNMILLDPNPQIGPSVPIPELDFAKAMQSVCGWEEFIYGRRSDLKWRSDLIPITNRLFGHTGWQTCTWFLITHLIRTLPYGAKINNAYALLHTIKKFTKHLEDDL